MSKDFIDAVLQANGKFQARASCKGAEEYKSAENFASADEALNDAEREFDRLYVVRETRAAADWASYSDAPRASD